MAKPLSPATSSPKREAAVVQGLGSGARGPRGTRKSGKEALHPMGVGSAC